MSYNILVMRRRSLVTGFCLSAGLFTLWSFLLFHTDLLTSLDQRIYDIISHWKSPFWLDLNASLSFLGDWKFILFLSVLLGVYLLCRNGWRQALWPFASVFLMMKITMLFKAYFSRTRPQALDPQYQWQHLAYPSGHSSESFVFYGIATWIFLQIFPHHPWTKKSMWGSGILIGAIGLSRIFLGVHWMSDVVGGFLLGASWLCLNLILVRKFSQKLFRSFPIS